MIRQASIAAVTALISIVLFSSSGYAQATDCAVIGSNTPAAHVEVGGVVQWINALGFSPTSSVPCAMDGVISFSNTNLTVGATIITGPYTCDETHDLTTLSCSGTSTERGQIDVFAVANAPGVVTARVSANGFTFVYTIVVGKQLFIPIAMK